MDFDFHRLGGASGAYNSQKLPSFAMFLSFSTSNAANPAAQSSGPSSTLTGSSMPSPTRASTQTRQVKMPPPSSAGDKFRDWFPEPSVERSLRSVLTDPWSNKAPASPFGLETSSTKLRSALLGPLEEDNGPPRRTSLPSISSLTSRVNQDDVLDQNMWRRASTSNTLAGSHLLTLHKPQGTTMSSSLRNNTLPPGHLPGPSFLHMLPTRTGPLDRQPLTITPPQTFEGALEGHRRQSRISAEDAPSPPPPSPATPAIPGRGTASSDFNIASLPSPSLDKILNKGKSRKVEEPEEWPGDGRGESERKRYMCPYQGCGRQYTWKENLTRHHTTRHAPMPTPRRCPFCKVNASRLSFNRIDNFKEHILRHSRERDNCRARTEFHPAAEAFYRRLSEEAKGERRRVKGRERRMSPRSEASDDSVGASGEL